MAKKIAAVCILVLLLFLQGLSEPLALDNDSIVITQQIPLSALPGSEFVVKINIQKTNISGIAKLQQNLPQGFSATEDESKNAKFIFEDHVVKFIWDKLPDENSFQVAYKVSVGANVRGIFSVAGIFAYLSGSDRILVNIDSAQIKIEDQKIIAVVKEEVKIEEPPVENIPPTASKAPEPIKTESLQKPSPKVDYRIQIAAAYREIQLNFLANKYNIQEKVSPENHNRMHKYTVGSHNNYKSAKAHLYRVIEQYGVEGAFITAYNNGKRISVKSSFQLTK